VNYKLPHKLIAEFIGTFTLLFIVVGSICADHVLKAGKPDAPGLGLLGIAAANGLAITVMVSALGHISGGHFNPAVTIGLWVTKRIATWEALLYWIAQLAGASAGAYLIKLILPEDVWRGVSLGTPALAAGFPRANAMALEAILTFLLLWVVFATVVDERGGFGKIAGFAIGLTVTMDILLGGPFTGAAINPARAFGPALAGNYWAAQGVYWVGPLFGGAVAAALYDALYLNREKPE
jgi:MIP family channel proteins